MFEKMGMKITVEAIHRDKDGNIINYQKHVFDPKIEKLKKLAEQLEMLRGMVKEINEVNS